MKFKHIAILLALSTMVVGPFAAKADGQEAKESDTTISTPRRNAATPGSATENGVQARIAAQLELKQHLDGLQAALQAIQAEEAKGPGAQSAQALRDAQLDIKQQLDELVASLQAVQAEETEASPKQASIVEDLNRQAQVYAKQAAEFSKQLKTRDLQLQMLSQQMGEMNRLQNLPPIEGEVKIFSLAHVPAADAAKQVLSLFGGQAVRVAIDGRTNSLIVFGKSDYHSPIEAILSKLDAQGEGNADAPRTAPPKKPNSRSVLLRVFWLADGLPKGEGEPLDAYLPAGVIKAVGRLGLKDPRLVAQTVNSLASRDEKVAEFSSRVPAVVLHEPAQLTCTGEMWPIVDDRTELQVQLSVSGSRSCELTGSLVLPLAHYMVLGTANSVAGDMAMMPGMPGMEGGGMGMSMGGEMGRGMMGGGRGGFAVPGGEGGVMPEGGEMGMAAPDAEGAAGVSTARQPKFETSRFAFVLQVTDGESFPPEE